MLILSVSFPLYSWRKILYERYRQVSVNIFKSDWSTRILTKTKNRLYSQLRYITTKDMENKSNRQMKYSQCPESSGAGFQVFFSTRRHRPYFLASSDLQGHVRVVLCREVPWNQQRKEGWRGRYISTLRTTGMSRPHCPDAPLFLVNKTPSTRSIPRTGIGWGFLGGLMC